MFSQDKFCIQLPQEIEWDVSIPMRVFIEDHVPEIHPIAFHIGPTHQSIEMCGRLVGGTNPVLGSRNNENNWSLVIFSFFTSL